MTRARRSGVESLSDHTEMPTVPSDSPKPKSTAATQAIAGPPTPTRQHMAQPAIKMQKKTTEPLKTPTMSNTLPEMALDAVRQPPATAMTVAACMRSIPFEVSRMDR